MPDGSDIPPRLTTDADLARVLATALREALTPRNPPLFLTREEAAEYVGVSVAVFDAEVAAGRWPKPERRGAKGTKPTWHRAALDAAAAKGFPAPSVSAIQPESAKLDGAQEAALKRLRRHHARSA
jgi:predicted DNA-binding transcriptional regulator AlpA